MISLMLFTAAFPSNISGGDYAFDIDIDYDNGEGDYAYEDDSYEVDYYEDDDGYDSYSYEDSYSEPVENSYSGGESHQTSSQPVVTPSVSVPYPGYCPYAKIFSPVYEGMDLIYGVSGPGCEVTIVVNCEGKSGKWNFVPTDKTGLFHISGIPVELKEGDDFNIYVKDSAGNTTSVHQKIDKAGDSAMITSDVNPVGKLFYSGKKKSTDAYWAVPVSKKDFQEKDVIEIPLLWGMSYEAGTMTIKKTENGVVVSSEILITSERVKKNDKEGLYVYSSVPSLKALKNLKGEKVEFGEEIPLNEEECIWIQDICSLSVPIEDIAHMNIYDFENSDIYHFYQEYKNE